MSPREMKSAAEDGSFTFDGTPLGRLLAAACPEVSAPLAGAFVERLRECDAAIEAQLREQSATFEARLQAFDAAASAQQRSILDALDAARSEIASLRSRLEAIDGLIAELRAPPPAIEKPVPPSLRPDAAPARTHQSAGALTTESRSGYRMRYARPGTFTMGSTDHAEADHDEFPPHTVMISRGFFIGEVPVTWGLWSRVRGQHPQNTDATDRPVTGIDWLEACRFANSLSEFEGYAPAYRFDGAVVHWSRDANGFRLPTEAEWEYAARAGIKANWAGADDAFRVAWTRENSMGATHAVASKDPNPWGLHDMSGNVFEWCWDYKRPYAPEPSTDPLGPAAGTHRARRGGAFDCGKHRARVAYRGALPPAESTHNTGLRLVRWAD